MKTKEHFQEPKEKIKKEKKNLLKSYVFLQLSFSPSTPMNSHVRVICLLVSLLLACCGLAVVCGLLGASYGMHTLSFMAAEVSTTSRPCSAQMIVDLHL